MEAKACNLRPLGGGNFTIKQSAQIVHCIQDYILIYYVQSFLLFSVGVQTKSMHLSPAVSSIYYIDSENQGLLQTLEEFQVLQTWIFIYVST